MWQESQARFVVGLFEMVIYCSHVLGEKNVYLVKRCDKVLQRWYVSPYLQAVLTSRRVAAKNAKKSILDVTALQTKKYKLKCI
jgi:hypothetical protein